MGIPYLKLFQLVLSSPIFPQSPEGNEARLLQRLLDALAGCDYRTDVVPTLRCAKLTAESEMVIGCFLLDIVGPSAAGVEALIHTIRHERGLDTPIYVVSELKGIETLSLEPLGDVNGYFNLAGCGNTPLQNASVSSAMTFFREEYFHILLVSKQHSSGGRSTFLGISKRGDSYLRTLLIHDARAVIYAAQRKTRKTDDWLSRLLARRNLNVAAVALANKNARIVWALLARNREFRSSYTTEAAAA